MIKQSNDLTQGNILRLLLKLALPIMGSQLVLMAYSLTDIAWLGRINSDAVASVAAASFVMWFGQTVAYMTKIGAEVTVSQAMGRRNPYRVIQLSQHALFVSFVIGVIYSIIALFISRPIVEVFDFDKKHVVEDSVLYLRTIAPGMLFAFINPTFTGCYNGIGNSKKPFLISACGLIANMILDPLLIFGIGPWDGWGIAGAGIATVIAQVIVFAIFLASFLGKNSPLPSFRIKNLFTEVKFRYVKSIVKIGFPASIQYSFFCVIAFFMARIAARWGELPIAVQGVGAQIESLSWMTAGGFSVALASFVGQNYGARRWKRIKKGYYTTLLTIFTIGCITSYVFYFHGNLVFSLFIPKEDAALALGTTYLKILGISQVFMCIEIVSTGAFNGIGRPALPSFINVITTLMRIPVALFLSTWWIGSWCFDSVTAVWWSVTICTIIKGIFTCGSFITALTIQVRRRKCLENRLPPFRTT